MAGDTSVDIEQALRAALHGVLAYGGDPLKEPGLARTIGHFMDAVLAKNTLSPAVQHVAGADQAAAIRTTSDDYESHARLVGELIIDKGPLGSAPSSGPQRTLMSVVATSVTSPAGGDIVQPTIVDDPAVSFSTSTVLRHNRFVGLASSDRGYVADRRPFPASRGPVDARSIDSREFATVGSQLGLNAALVGSDATPSGRGLSHDDMKKIGLALMLRATGIDLDDPTTIDSADDIQAVLEAAGVASAATRIAASDLYAGNLTAVGGPIRSPTAIDVVSSGDSPLLDGSYGQLNSFIAPFDGFAPISMMLLGMALTLAVEGALLGLFALIAPKSALSAAEQIVNGGVSRDFPGKHNHVQASAFLSGIMSLDDLGLRQTRNSFTLCVKKGIETFFGFNDGASYANVLRAPGFYAMFNRAILRGGNLLVAATDQIVEQVTSSPINAAQSTLGFIDAVRRSKIMAAMNVFAQLGDVQIDLEAGLGAGDSASTALAELYARVGVSPTDIGIVSTIDALKVETGAKVGHASSGMMHVIKSREFATRTGSGRVRDRRLAMRTSAVESTYLLPTSIIVATSKYAEAGAGSQRAFERALSSDQFIRVTTGRIGQDDALALEKRLDAEYVPFYFHDLRTNEIVSFHAFLASLTDNYAVKYDETEAYGRVDPIMAYANTRRSISMSFHVVATSVSDFDEMWWKVNKLTTLVYPQWSRGRDVVLNDTVNPSATRRFTMPMSQRPAASPLIRIRLGDLIKTNYSRFALARLFGLGTPSYGDASSPGPAAGNPTASAIMAAARAATGAALGALSDRITSGVRAIYWLPTESLGDAIIGYKWIDVISADPTDDSIIIVKDINTGDLMRAPRGSIDVIGASEPVTTPAASALTSIPGDLKFDDSNPIVRSFESAGGRGLAGVITSIEFDWYTNALWETSHQNRRAPQMCKVSLSFQPIHDIAPGLDADGFNRAPIYNVGSYAAAALLDSPGGTVQDALGDISSEQQLSPIGNIT